MDFNKDPAETSLGITTILENVKGFKMPCWNADWLLTPPHNCVIQTMDVALTMHGRPT